MPDREPAPDPILITAREFARRAGVETETVRRWVRAGKLLPAGKTPGGHLRFRPEQVQELLNPPVAGLAAKADGKALFERAWQELRTLNRTLS